MKFKSPLLPSKQLGCSVPSIHEYNFKFGDQPVRIQATSLKTAERILGAIAEETRCTGLLSIVTIINVFEISLSFEINIDDPPEFLVKASIVLDASGISLILSFALCEGNVRVLYIMAGIASIR